MVRNGVWSRSFAKRYILLSYSPSLTSKQVKQKPYQVSLPLVKVNSQLRALLLLLLSIFQSSLPSIYLLRSRLRDMEISLKSSLEKCAAKMQGQIRAQQVLILWQHPKG